MTITHTVDETGEYWRKDGRPHREDGPAMIRADGSRVWMIEGQFHRDDGPAFANSFGYHYYYRHGKLHRTDGPAIYNLTKPLEDIWSINNIIINEQVLAWMIEFEINPFWREWADADKVLFRLKFA